MKNAVERDNSAIEKYRDKKELAGNETAERVTRTRPPTQRPPCFSRKEGGCFSRRPAA